MYWIIGAMIVYLGIGLFIGHQMFDYPVGSFWHIMVALFWPATFLLLLFMR
jgi:hypothetical protein